MVRSHPPDADLQGPTSTRWANASQVITGLVLVVAAAVGFATLTEFRINALSERIAKLEAAADNTNRLAELIAYNHGERLARDVLQQTDERFIRAVSAQLITAHLDALRGPEGPITNLTAEDVATVLMDQFGDRLVGPAGPRGQGADVEAVVDRVLQRLRSETVPLPATQELVSQVAERAAELVGRAGLRSNDPEDVAAVLYANYQSEMVTAVAREAAPQIADYLAENYDVQGPAGPPGQATEITAQEVAAILAAQYRDVLRPPPAAPSMPDIDAIAQAVIDRYGAQFEAMGSR